MKTKSNEKLKTEAEKCLAQSEKFQNEKAEFETTIYSKVLTINTIKTYFLPKTTSFRVSQCYVMEL